MHEVLQSLFCHRWFYFVIVFCLKLQWLANNVYASPFSYDWGLELPCGMSTCQQKNRKNKSFYICFSYKILFSFILLNLMKVELKWQTTFEVTNLLDGNDAKWIFRSCNQLHVYVVSSSNRCHHIQVSWM